MDLHHLKAIFHPQRIAIIGISSNPNSVSGNVLINLVSGGFRGVVYPVNAAFEAVMGIPCFANIESLPRVPELAIIATSPEEVPDIIDQCGKKGVKGVIIMTAGFRETGEAGARLEEEVKNRMKQFPGMRILGPNCLGIIVPGENLNASFASAMPDKGNIAFISQSGALCTSVLDWAREERIGFSYFVSIGNALDVSFADLIDFFGEDDQTSCIILYVESIADARAFMAASRAFARRKPIIVYKAGRFPESAQVAASHTGAMASEDAIYDAAFQRAGLARVYEIGDIFNVAEIVGRGKFPRGSRLGIVTNAGGPGVMATDALIALNGELAKLDEETIAILNQQLPPAWSHTNPVDVLGDARAKRISKAVKVVLDDKQVDAILVILTPQAMTNPAAAAREVIKVASDSTKPVLAAWLGGERMNEGVELLSDAGIPCFHTPEEAIQAFMTLVAYSRNLQALYETPKDIPVSFSVDRQQLHDQFLQSLGEQTTMLSEASSKEILEKYGVPTSMPLHAHDAEQAVILAEKIGYPVVMKIDSPDISHKSDVGGVMLDLIDQEMVRHAFNQMMDQVHRKAPAATLNGVTIQRMMNTKDAAELILGIKKDPVFGTIIMIGMGGIYAELFQDKSLGMPPLNEALARHMLESLKIWPVLNGYRGKPPLNVDKLIDLLIRISYLAADFPEIEELDINPLLVTPKDVIALDARMAVTRQPVQDGGKTYAHLALHPYPEKFVKRVSLQDGTSILLRPIKPEDEPLWLDMLRHCSKESLYSRFRYFFHWETHEIATRYCYIDYDRELAIVAETESDGEKELVGVGRLIADPDREKVEYAILIIDAWQNRDLGNLITDFCMEIARKWNIKKIYAQTTSDNGRMISMFEKRGFAITHDDKEGIVEVERTI